MLELHALFIALLVGTELFFTALAVVNLRYGERAVRDEESWVRNRLDVDDPERMLDYNRAKLGIGLLETWVGLGFVLLVLYSGLLGDVVDAIESTGWHPLLRGVVFFLATASVFYLAELPFDAVDSFVVEEIFDFNRQTARLWVRDSIVGLGISLVFTAVLGGAVLAFIGWLPTLWWLAAWVLFVGFSLIMLVIYPRVIAPLFNDFEPVDAGDLRQAVTDVFDRAGFSCSQIYVMDASRRSSHSNAYFVGFGRTKRVVLFDTLIDQMSIPEIQSVLAHELAHWKRAHVWKRLAGSAVRMGVMLFVLWYLIDTPWLYAMFGLPAGTEYVGLVVASLWLLPLSRLSAPIENRLSLKHEREADTFAVRIMGNGDHLVDALCRLVGENLSNPFPHPVYATFHYTHPPIPDRIRHIRERASGADDVGDDEGEPPASTST